MIEPASSVAGAPVNVDSVVVNSLSPDEASEFVSLLQLKLGLSEEQAQDLLGKATPQQARSLLALHSGEQQITKQDAQELWGLSDQEADVLFGGKNVLGSFNNPFGEAFLFFMQLSYAFELDLKKMIKGLLTARVESAESAAQERKTGAIIKFATSMTSAALTVGGAALHAGLVPSTKVGQGSQWTGPLGLSLVTQPVNAGGEFGDQIHQYEASLRDIEAEEANALYQQIEANLNSSERVSEDMAKRL